MACCIDGLYPGPSVGGRAAALGLDSRVGVEVLPGGDRDAGLPTGSGVWVIGVVVVVAGVVRASVADGVRCMGLLVVIGKKT